MSLSFVINSSFLYDDSDFADYQLFHFRLTDSALRDLEQLAGTLGEEKFQLSISGSQHSFAIPLPDRLSTFTFSITNLNKSSDGSFDCLRISRGRVRCLGRVKSRFTVNAKEDSFSMAREKMVQLEDESRRTQTKELGSYRKQPRRFTAQSIDPKKPTNTVSRLSDPRLSLNNDATSSLHINSSPGSFPHGRQSDNSPDCRPSPPIPNLAISNRSLRERVIHILALRPYQRPELLVRLKRDGISQLQKDQLDDVLSEVGQLGRRSAYHLIPSVIAELDPFWPGYSAGEKSRILSLKERQRTSPSTGSPINRSHTASPANPSSTRLAIADDQFSRRPTRASAPAAPHALSKKIAALDLLAQGLNESDVACRIGVSRDLLSQWRTTETELRERFARLNSKSDSSTNQDNTTQGLQSTQPQSLPADKSSRSSSFPKPGPFGSHTPSPTADQCAVSPAREPSISPPKRARLSSSHLTHTASDLDSVPSSQSANHTKPRTNASDASMASFGMSERRSYGSSLCDDLGRPAHLSNASHSLSPTGLRETLNQSLYVQQQQHQTHFGSGGSGGSEGESAAHTPCSNISSGSSTYGGLPPGQLSTLMGATDNGVRRVNRNGQSFRLPSGTFPQPVSCDLDEPSSVHVACSHDNGTNPQNGSSLQGATSVVLEEPSPELTSKLAEIDRTFPKISKTSQIEQYRVEFKRTYPAYLRLYHSFSDIWKAVNSLYCELLKATRTEGMDSLITSRLADQLDALLRRARTQHYRDEQIELTVKAHKLRLLKQRLAEARSSEAVGVLGAESGKPDLNSTGSTNRAKFQHKQSSLISASDLISRSEPTSSKRNLDTSGNGRAMDFDNIRSGKPAIV